MDPHMSQGSKRDASASLLLVLVPTAHTKLGPFPPLASAVTAALYSSLQEVSCLHPGLQQRVSPK